MDVQLIIQDAKDGNKDPLEAYILLKAMQGEIEDGLTQLKDLAMNEASKYGKSFDRYGAHVELRNGPSRFNFKGIEAITKAEARAKYLQELAKIGGVDEESGEVIPKAPKVEGASTIAIKILS